MLEYTLMKLFYFFIAFTLLFCSQTVFAACSITSVLRMGSKGAEVECLQGKVGTVADGVFGPKTAAAVMVFQSNNGLVPDGVVGPLSRAVLNGTVTNNDNSPVGCTETSLFSSTTGLPCSSTANLPTGCTEITGYSPLTGVKCDSNSNAGALNSPINNNYSAPLVVNNDNTESTNPNLVNLDQFINAVVDVNRENGKSEQELGIIADALRKVVVESDIDYNKKFEELLISESKLSANPKPRPFFGVLDKVFEKTFSFLGITPSPVEAAAGIPFGGTLIFPFYCAYSGNWMITITPLPPSFAVLLSYTIGTQKFASYNIPFTRYLLGFYTPPGECVIPAGPAAIVIPTEGTISPMTGSSPL